MNFIGISAIFGILVLTKGQNLWHDKIVVCPAFPQWYLDANRSEFNMNEADWNCTHILLLDLYDGLTREDEDDIRERDMEKIPSLRKKFPYLKAISLTREVVRFFENYLDCVDEKCDVRNFIDGWVMTLKNFNLNGLDLDWSEFVESLKAIQDVTYASNLIFDLLIELKREFDKEDLLLTMSFSAEMPHFVKDFHISKFAEYFDFVHFMPTRLDDYRRVFKKLDMNYAILELKSKTIHEKLDRLILWGVPESKLILGVNFRGIIAKTKLYGNVNDAKTSNYIDYNVLCQLSSDEWKKSYDADTELTMLSSDQVEEKRKLIYLYGSSRTIANTMKFVVRSRNLAGVLVLGSALDDYKGECLFNATDTFIDFDEDERARIPRRTSNELPLLKTVNEVLFVTSPLHKVNGIISHTRPNKKPTTKSTTKPENNMVTGTISDYLRSHSFYSAITLFVIVLVSNIN